MKIRASNVINGDVFKHIASKNLQDMKNEYTGTK